MRWTPCTIVSSIAPIAPAIPHILFVALPSALPDARRLARIFAQGSFSHGRRFPAVAAQPQSGKIIASVAESWGAHRITVRRGDRPPVKTPGVGTRPAEQVANGSQVARRHRS